MLIFLTLSYEHSSIFLKRIIYLNFRIIDNFCFISFIVNVGTICQIMGVFIATFTFNVHNI